MENRNRALKISFKKHGKRFCLLGKERKAHTHTHMAIRSLI